ncbi:MAG TPA: ribbon-helix-helix domain-containing protein [Anaerolineae bacterium]|nr:ribbon-helix-helix domain-containing protein [Anaerolineae bacterium]
MKDKDLYAIRENYTMPVYVNRALNEYSEKTGMPKSRVVRMAIIEYLKIEKPETQTAQVAQS